MADSSFEDQMRKELEQLRLKPDEQVWANVDAALREERKRRWLFWFVLGGILLLGGGTYLFMQHDMIRPVAAEHSNQNYLKQNHSGQNEKQSAAPVTSQIRVDSIIAAPKKIGNELTPAISVKHSGADHNAGYTHKATGVYRSASPRHIIITTDKTQPSSPRISLAEKSITDIALLKADDTTKQPNPPMDLNLLQSNDVGGPAVKIPTKLSERRDTLKKSSEDQQTTTTKPVRVSKWEWYISFDGGKSSFRNKLFASQNNFLNFSNAASSIPPGGLVNGFVTPIYHDAFSMAAAAQVLKKINTRSAIGLSAGYALFRTSIDVGKRFDTLLNFSSVNRTNTNGFVYRPTDTSSRPYTNNYHFITLNLDYYRYLKISTTDLRWRLGIGAAIVAGSNALHFDNGSGFLFQNNILIPDIQWNVSTGLDFGLPGKRFFIGPQLTYFLTRSSAMPSSSLHFMDAALRFSMRLKKEKK